MASVKSFKDGRFVTPIRRAESIVSIADVSGDEGALKLATGGRLVLPKNQMDLLAQMEFSSGSTTNPFMTNIAGCQTPRKRSFTTSTPKGEDEVDTVNRVMVQYGLLAKCNNCDGKGVRTNKAEQDETMRNAKLEVRHELDKKELEKAKDFAYQCQNTLAADIVAKGLAYRMGHLNCGADELSSSDADDESGEYSSDSVDSEPESKPEPKLLPIPKIAVPAASVPLTLNLPGITQTHVVDIEGSDTSDEDFMAAINSRAVSPAPKAQTPPITKAQSPVPMVQSPPAPKVQIAPAPKAQTPPVQMNEFNGASPDSSLASSSDEDEDMLRRSVARSFSSTRAIRGASSTVAMDDVRSDSDSSVSSTGAIYNGDTSGRDELDSVKSDSSTATATAWTIPPADQLSQSQLLILHQLRLVLAKKDEGLKVKDLDTNFVREFLKLDQNTAIRIIFVFGTCKAVTATEDPSGTLWKLMKEIAKP